MPPSGWRAREIAAQQLILLLGRPGLAGGDLEIGVALEDAALGRAGLEFLGDDAHRDAGRAIEAGGAIGDVLAAPEADPAERVVELAGMRPRKLGEHLPLGPARQIGARRGRGHEETRKAERCAQVNSTGSMIALVVMMPATRDGKRGCIDPAVARFSVGRRRTDFLVDSAPDGR